MTVSPSSSWPIWERCPSSIRAFYQPGVSVSFALEGASTAGVTAAFAKVDRVYLLFVRPDSAQRDIYAVVLQQFNTSHACIRVKQVNQAGAK